MNAPFSRVAHGRPDAYRELIAENAWYAAVQADLAQTHAAIGDDVGLEYAVRRLVAYTRQIAGTLADLKQHKAEARHGHV